MCSLQMSMKGKIKRYLAILLAVAMTFNSTGITTLANTLDVSGIQNTANVTETDGETEADVETENGGETEGGGEMEAGSETEVGDETEAGGETEIGGEAEGGETDGNDGVTDQLGTGAGAENGTQSEGDAGSADQLEAGMGETEETAAPKYMVDEITLSPEDAVFMEEPQKIAVGGTLEDVKFPEKIILKIHKEEVKIASPFNASQAEPGVPEQEASVASPFHADYEENDIYIEETGSVETTESSDIAVGSDSKVETVEIPMMEGDWKITVPGGGY